ncbi:hypothetical protein K458DRAFT_440942 [Lentithecium fluviatile CBS 122367]|uniref:G-protein coupled receptors family 2 profile 2 domain-containing protein n=1 Tax=Lentithecium fluviatile CBS 122367 TaxID=1168545 RepID=A0A6G1J9X9_9PLEO|nr:hypothetical protein K458DRAFT_440942 [Lentithecium fluviatile CBS 122367]
MPLGQFANQTQAKCTPLLLDKALFSDRGGYWQQQLRIPNYLSLLSVILCYFLLLSFAVLPAEATHRHYLSVVLLFPVLFISLSFAIPVSTDPHMCHDKITPHDMKSSMSCAWTGSLVTIGGLGCVVWVFLRSLSVHIRIFWDKDPGRRFKWGSIVFGTLMPLVFLIAILAVTGLSYRMGQTCLPNHENAIVTFWVDSQTRAKAETWTHVKRLFLLQWRNILVSVFVIIGSISFFIVFWTQDSKLGRAFDGPNNIKPVKTWIICQTLSAGDKEGCRKYVKDFTVDQAAVLTSLILASLVGIEIFILLFRVSMLSAWASLFRRGTHLLRKGRSPTPQLTSLENLEKYQPSSPRRHVPLFSSAFSADTPSSSSSNNPQRHSVAESGNTSAYKALSPPSSSPSTRPLLQWASISRSSIVLTISCTNSNMCLQNVLSIPLVSISASASTNTTFGRPSTHRTAGETSFMIFRAFRASP